MESISSNLQNVTNINYKNKLSTIALFNRILKLLRESLRLIESKIKLTRVNGLWASNTYVTLWSLVLSLNCINKINHGIYTTHWTTFELDNQIDISLLLLKNNKAKSIRIKPFLQNIIKFLQRISIPYTQNKSNTKMM